MTEKLKLFLLLAGLLGGTALTYWPGLPGPFLYDDYRTFIHDDNVIHFTPSVANAWAVMAPAPGELFSRPLAKLSFALDYHFAGGQFDSFRFKRTNLFIHLLNGLLLMIFSSQLATAPRPGKPQPTNHWLPLLVASIWLVHPLQLTTTLYVVQRMTSLMTLFVLAGLITYTAGRFRLSDQTGNKALWGKILMVAGVSIGTVAGMLCKENAVLLPAYALVLELTLFGRLPIGAAGRKFLRAFFLLFLLLPLVFAFWYLGRYPGVIFDAYQFRGFSLAERLLTEARVLFYYLYLLLAPGSGQYSLYHDDFPLSHGWLDPATTLLAVLAWLLALAAALRFRKAYPLPSFAVLWFLVGHSLEASIFGLELAWEHRNYLPGFGVVFALTAIAWQGYGKLQRTRLLAVMGVLFPVALVAVLAGATHSLAETWSNKPSYATYNLTQHPQSCGAHNMMANSLRLGGGDIREIYSHYLICAQLEPTEITGLMEMRTAAGLLFARMKSPGETATDRENLPAPSWHSPLHLEEGYLHRLITALDQEINRRLGIYPLTDQGVAALQRAVTCATRQTECQALLSDLQRWIKISLTAKVTGAGKPTLHLLNANLYAREGQTDQAMQELNHAVRLSPRSDTMKIHRIALCLATGEPDLANKYLLELEQHPNRRSNLLRTLRVQVDAAMGKASPPH